MSATEYSQEYYQWSQPDLEEGIVDVTVRHPLPLVGLAVAAGFATFYWYRTLGKVVLKAAMLQARSHMVGRLAAKVHH